MKDVMLSSMTIKELREYLDGISEYEFERIKGGLFSDSREGVRKLVISTEHRFEAERCEYQRVRSLYEFEESFSDKGHGAIIIGLDEVGRGPLAGPLAVGAVVLNRDSLIMGLNDSKKLSHASRSKIAQSIFDKALATAVVYIEPDKIDMYGMSQSLRLAFGKAIKEIENQDIHADVVLIDGNPLNVDQREINVIKGDAKCASIAAASIIAKESRDALMVSYAQIYPQYHLESSKGYASAEHIAAIQQFGLSPIHRKSFCHNFTQESLF